MALAATALSTALFILIERWEPRHPPAKEVAAQPNPIVAPAGGPIRAIRRRVAKQGTRGPSIGSFVFIPLRWWRWLLLALAAGLLMSDVIV